MGNNRGTRIAIAFAGFLIGHALYFATGDELCLLFGLAGPAISLSMLHLKGPSDE